MDLQESVLTVAEIAEKLKVTADTVRRLFSTEPDVIVLCSPAPGKRPYRTLRVPPRVLLRVLTRLTRGFHWRLRDLDEPFFTPDEIAQSLKLDLDTVRRILVREPGVIVICFPRPATRTYRTLRVPHRVLVAFVERLTPPTEHRPPDPIPAATVHAIAPAATAALIRTVASPPHFRPGATR